MPDWKSVLQGEDATMSLGDVRDGRQMPDSKSVLQGEDATMSLRDVRDGLCPLPDPGGVVLYL